MKYIVEVSEGKIVDFQPVPDTATYTAADCKRVLAAIKPGEKVNTAEIAKRTGLHYFTALRRLNDLISEGKVKRIGKSYGARYRRV